LNVITLSKNATLNNTPNFNSLRRLFEIMTWPFTHRYASPIWLVVRLYAASIWVQFGLGKLNAGWTTSDPIGGIFKAVASGALKVPFEPFRGLAGWMLEHGITPHISHAMPFLEMAVGLSFITGVLIIPAAIGSILLIINIQLSGTGSFAFDLRVASLSLSLILAYRVSSLIGFQALVVRILKMVASAVRNALPGRLLTTAQVGRRS
jgi:uncharacterized membrane protein YphA (DoxX/SURF4 family)